jgi:hypothetical protein
MSHVIYRYPLSDALGRQPREIRVTKGRVLKVLLKGGRWPCAWVLQAVEEPEFMTLRLVGTGEELSPTFMDRFAYLDTFQDAPFVWHVFQRRSEEDEAWHRRQRMGQPHPVEVIPL